MIFVLYKEIQRIFFIHRLEANKYYVIVATLTSYHD